MKKLILAAVVLYGAVSCTNAPTNEVPVTEAQAVALGVGQTLVVDTKQSSVYWKGTKVGGMHDGTLGIKDGSLTLDDKLEVASGTFTIDMNAMTNFDLAETPEVQAQLLGHLKSADFFEVETYPTSVFTITEVTEAPENDAVSHYISGNLKMKDVEKNIKFGANVSANVVKKGDSYVTEYRAETVPFVIDRTEWNVKFGSKKLFPDLKEFIVDENIELKITIVATVK